MVMFWFLLDTGLLSGVLKKIHMGRQGALFIFFAELYARQGAKKTSVVWSTPHHYKKGPRAIGPSDSVVLLKATGILKTQTPRDQATLLRSNSLKSLTGSFCGAHQMPMGKLSWPLKGPLMPGPLDPDIY